MICDRIFVGLVFFQLTTAGQLILQQAVTRSVLLTPLVAATIWCSVLYNRAYKPLMKFIALRSVKRGQAYSDLASPSPEGDASTVSSNEFAPERNVWAENDGLSMRHRGELARAKNRFGPAALDEGEGGLRYVNPSLVAPLQKVMIADKSLARAWAAPEVEDGVEEESV